MSEQPLFDAVTRLAELTASFTDIDLDQPWAWRAHDEGVRFALLGTIHELRELAVALGQRRATSGPPLTRAQRALAPYHVAYRDLQAVLIGVGDEMYDQVPAPGEWSLRHVLGHIIGAERHFFTLVHYGVERQQHDPQRPSRMPEEETEKVTGAYAGFIEIMEKHGMAELLAFYQKLHRRAMVEFAAISDEELAGPSLWWEGEEYPLQYRLHRFEAHLRQHTIQAEKTLAAAGLVNSEVKRLLRLAYNALADVENATTGAPQLGMTSRQDLAAQITARAQDAAGRVAQTRRLAAAVQAGELDTVKDLLAEDAVLADTQAANGISLVLTAAYNGRQDIVSSLVEASANLTIFEGAAVGRFDVVKNGVKQWPGYLNLFNRDGFTPLQLACFFGHEEIALWLIEQGSDIHAAAQNGQQIQPIHAAAANGSLPVLRALLGKGADVNARQQNDYTPLHTAADSGDAAMATLFLDHQADTAAKTEDGRTPLDIAQEKGNHDVAALLAAASAA